MKGLLNLNNISLLIIIFITILLIHLRFTRNHIHYHSKNEGYQNIFNPNTLSSMLTRIKGETTDTNNIKTNLRILKQDNNKNKCIIPSKDKEGNINYNIDDNLKTEKECKDNNPNNIFLKPLKDTSKLRILNKDIKETADKLDTSNIVSDVEQGIQHKRIQYLKTNINKYKQNDDTTQSYNNIKSIKNPKTSTSISVKKIKPNDNDDNKYQLFINNTENNNDIKCLSFDINKQKIFNKKDTTIEDITNYYSIKKCDVNDTTQHLSLNKHKLEQHCYDYPSMKKNNKELIECIGTDVIIKENNDEFIKSYNKNIPIPFHINNNLIGITPNKFITVTPNKKLKTEKYNQCLTIDNNGVSFQECTNRPNQRWNYSSTNISC